jgi:hypothetical protein
MPGVRQRGALSRGSLLLVERFQFVQQLAQRGPGDDGLAGLLRMIACQTGLR